MFQDVTVKEVEWISSDETVAKVEMINERPTIIAEIHRPVVSITSTLCQSTVWIFSLVTLITPLLSIVGCPFFKGFFKARQVLISAAFL